MTDLHKAAQQALEALKNLSNCHDGPHDSSGECPSCHERSYMPHAPDCEKQNAITALRDALAQQTQTPCDIAEDGVCEVIDCCRNSTQEEQEPTARYKCTVVDDQHPNGVPFEQWVNAPQQEAPKGGGKLPPPLQAEPVEEPVAWMTHTNDLLPLFHKNRKAALNWQTQPTPLYTAPPRREWQGLTEEEIDRWTPEIHPVIRAVEQALKEKNA